MSKLNFDQIMSQLVAGDVIVKDAHHAIITMGKYLNCSDVIRLHDCGCGDCVSQDVNARPSIGQMPSGVGQDAGSVQPLDAPTSSSIVEKIDTQSKAKAMNSVLHTFWKILDKNAGSESALNKEKIVVAHTALVEKMKKRNWLHAYMDSLDDTLPAHLRSTIVGPENPVKKPTEEEREPITVAPVDDKNVSLGGTMHVALPEVQVSTSSCVRLRADDAKKFLGKTDKITPDLPEDALYLMVDAVETGVFNKVEITKEELEQAAPDYAGRMFVEGHEWNDPKKAIGQVLKAKVIFSATRGKWVMQVLAVILREDAIKNFERGLYKFVSIGATMKAICSVCGLTIQDGCRHIKGMIYETPNGKVECKYKASELQMEELSAVNVPACRTASAYGKVSREQARDLLAASLEKGCGENLLSLEAAIDLQEIIYRNSSESEQPGDVKHMAKWQEDFRIHDAQGYNNLLQRAELYPMLSRTYGDLLAHRKIPGDVDSLLFAHELLHRWFNQPSRIKGWTEEEIATKHDQVIESLTKLSVQVPDVSVMDAVLHAQSKADEASDVEKAPDNDKGFDPVFLPPPGKDAKSDDAPAQQPKSKKKTEIEQVPMEDDEKVNKQPKESAQPFLTKMPIQNSADSCDKPCKDDKCPKCGKKDDDCKCKDLETCDKCEQKKCECYNNASLKSDKVLSQTDNNSSGKDSGNVENSSCKKDEKDADKTGDNDEPKLEAVSLSDAEARRSGCRDGAAKAQAGSTKAQGKDTNEGANVDGGSDYRSGYQKGYKEAKKNSEPNYVNEQISKGGVKMAVENTEQVVLEKTKDEARKSGAIKDFGTRKEQGEAKTPVDYKGRDDNEMKKADEKKLETNSTHDYKDEVSKAKPEVKYEKPDKEGGSYGMLKCPKCNQGNIMGDSPKCPGCGASNNELIPIKEEERMGDFPYQKTHSAYDAPPMEAKTPGVPTPAAQKSKMSLEDDSVSKLVSESQSELRLVKEHLSKITVQFETERTGWYGERRELIGANQGLGEKLSQVEDELGTVKLDLNTKSSMYKTLLEEHQNLMKRLDEHARLEKRQIAEEIVNSNVRLGLISDVDCASEIQRYLEKPIETLRVLHEEVTKNTKRIADMMLGKKFGVPVDGKQDTTEKGKVSKGATVGGIDEAKAKAKVMDEIAKKDEPLPPPPMDDKDADAVGAITSGATKDSNTIFAQVCRSLKNNRRNK